MHSPVRPARRHISADPQTLRRPRSTSADHRPRPHQWWTCESQYGIRQDSRNKSPAHRSRPRPPPTRSSSHFLQDSSVNLAYWRVQSRAQCASSQSRDATVTQVVPPSVRSVDVRYTTSTSFSVGGTAVTADLDLDEARFGPGNTAHILYRRLRSPVTLTDAGRRRLDTVL